MCGIVAVIGKNNQNISNNIVLGLEKLEYRGYDSAGIAIISNKEIICKKAVGTLDNLKSILDESPINGYAGIGHTRWATHGKPTEQNAHPILAKNIAIVHNGIIENYKELKFDMQKDGYVFNTATDSEVIANLLQREIDKNFSPKEAMQNISQLIEGTYAFAAIFSNFTDQILVAKNRSPLIIGFGENIYAASDASSVASFCNEVTYLEDGDFAIIKHNEIKIFDKNFNEIIRKRHVISEDLKNNGKGQYKHFMLKEIMEQPNALRKTILHNKINGDFLKNISRILILACGTSYHAGMVAKYWFEKFLKIPTTVEIASEFRYRSPVIEDKTLVIAITQSGETIDTLEAMEYVRKNSNSKVVVISNVKNSAISRIADLVFYTEAGLEIGVASTKAFTAQLVVLANIAFCHNEFLLQEIQNLPAIIDAVLDKYQDIQKIAEQIKDAHSAIFLGRDSLYPIALEGALKLKEISYIHAEGFAAGEMKHGPIALIDDNVPIICLCPFNEIFDKMLSNIQVAMARGKTIIVITDQKCYQIMPTEMTELSIILPNFYNEFAPILYVIPMQLLAYHAALLRGTDVDKPRNLAKSVTVE